MNKVTIEVGQKCYARTKVCRSPLLCTIEQVHANMVTLRLPCTLKGKTHVQVYMKDIIIQQQASKEQKPISKAPKDNPYRRHLQNILANPETNKAETQDISDERQQRAVSTVGNLVEHYLRDLPYEERKKELEAMSEENKSLYIHLLE